MGFVPSAFTQTVTPNIQTAEQSFVTYLVKPGDTLNRILSQYILPAADRANILQTNDLTNEHRILVGTTLRFDRADLRFRPALAKVMSLTCEQPIVSGLTAAPLSVGSDVTEGAVIRVPVDCHVFLAIEDGSVIRLPSSATLKFRTLRINALESIPEVHLELLRGRVEIGVEKRRNRQTPFKINTPTAILGVRGTEFRVGFEPETNHAQLEVISGKVAAQGNKDLNAQLVEHGLGLTFDNLGQASDFEDLLKAPSFVNVEKITARAPAKWVNFEGSTLAKAYVVDSANTANLSGVRYSQVVQEPRVAVGRLDDNAVFYKFAAISRSGLQGQTRQYGFCQPINNNQRCNVVFDVPLANGIPMTITLQREQAGMTTPVIQAHTIEAKNGRFLVQGLPMGRYEWALTYPFKQTHVTQTGSFDLQVLSAQTP